MCRGAALVGPAAVFGSVLGAMLAAWLLPGSATVLAHGVPAGGHVSHQRFGALGKVAGTIKRLRTVGKVRKLEDALEADPAHGKLGIAHTRWATHGVPSERNAHPHISRDGIAIVHNGIIENHEELRAELADTVERRFDETFAAVSAHFEEVAATLFPGGQGRLRLTEPGEDAPDAEPGVEVELRPAGKRVTRLSLLSGGEKALGAISFLFSLFLARPCAFYLLDEVEAALDDTNLGRLLEIYEELRENSQLLVITHQKRTMEVGDALYGVTMRGDGVSAVISQRLRDAESA